MIPKVTQDGPNILERYWCSDCGRYLVPNGRNSEAPGYAYCPGCGQHIEWEKAVPVKWEPMDCDTCGRPMIREVGGRMIDTGGYVGTTTCRVCMTEYCSGTNCLGCQRGSYPDCRWSYLKRRVPVCECEGQA